MANETQRSNLIIPEILTEAIQGELAGVIALMGTEAAFVNGSLPEGSQRGGDTVTVPFFGTLGELATVSVASPLTPTQLTMTSEDATVQHMGKMFEITYWAQLAANYADPYAEAARQLRVAVERAADAALITAAETTTLTHTNAGTDLTMKWDDVIDAKQLWADEQGDIALMVVHSKVYGDILKLKDSNGRPLVVESLRDGEVTRFGGIPLKVSDRMTVTTGTPDTYNSLIVKKNALAFWYSGAPRFLTDSDISIDSLMGAIHFYFAAHMYSRRPGDTKAGVVEIVSQ